MGSTANVTSAVRGYERRRSQRVHLAVPVELRWLTEEGMQVRQEAVTEVVSAHGAVLRLKTRYRVPPHLELRNPRTGQCSLAEAVWKDAREDGTFVLAVGLKTPSETLWGISVPALPPDPRAN